MRWLIPSWISPASRRLLVLLPFDDPLGELLQRLLPLGQPPVQPGVLDRARDQARHRAQQLDVGGGELAAQPGVHVQHPHQVTRAGSRSGTDAMEVNSSPRSAGMYR